MGFFSPRFHNTKNGTAILWQHGDMLQVVGIPVLSDNYVWVLFAEGETQATIVDPGSAEPVEAWLENHQKSLSTILVTHGHHDHTGGIAKLFEKFSIDVVGPSKDRVSKLTRAVSDGEKVSVAGHELEVIDVPAHTAGHVSYFGAGLVLTGDALFAGGCGRVFEGTFAQMHNSLARLANLPAETRMYCAHEYTHSNLRFALEVEPENKRLHERLRFTEVQRSLNEPTLPSTIGLELETNPFLRCEVPAVVEAARLHAQAEVAPGEETFEVLRHWKDSWRG
jgi:hydroxyacylglutathione hydrolase